MFNLTSKVNSLYITCAFSFQIYLSTLMKQLYGEPRPYWVSPNIESPHCMVEFGNPSGHCFVGSFFYLTLYLHFYYEVGEKRKKMAVFCTAYIVKMALTAGLMIFLIFLCFSRVYLGAHSYN